MAIYRGTGGATSVSGDATIEEVLGYSTTAQAAAAAAAASQAAAASSASGASTSASNAATSESNALTSANNAATSETNASNSAAAASVSETNAANSAATATAQVALAQAEVANAATEVTYATEWAVKAEDSLISVAAGGNGTTDYSARHWAAKAADIVAAGVIDDGVTSSLLTWSSTKISAEIAVAVPSQTGNGGFYLTTNGTNTSWSAVETLSATTLTAMGAL